MNANKIGVIAIGAAIVFAIFYVVSQLTKSNTVVAASVPGTPQLANSPLASNANPSGAYASGAVTSALGAFASLFSGIPSVSASPSAVKPTDPLSSTIYGPTAVVVGQNNGQPIYAATGFASTALNPATDPGVAPSLVVPDNPVDTNYVMLQPPGISDPGILDYSNLATYAN